MSKRSSKESQLIKAAISSFTQFGYESTSIDNVLDETKSDKKRVSRRTFYKYFDGKEAIFNSVRSFLEKHEALDYLNPEYTLSGNTPREMIINFLDNELKFLHDDSFIWSKINFRLLIDKELQDLLGIDVTTHSNKRKEFFKRVFTMMKSSNPELHAEMAVIFFKGLLFEIYSRESNSIKYDKEEFLNRIVNGILSIIN